MGDRKDRFLATTRGMAARKPFLMCFLCISFYIMFSFSLTLLFGKNYVLLVNIISDLLIIPMYFLFAPSIPFGISRGTYPFPLFLSMAFFCFAYNNFHLLHFQAVDTGLQNHTAALNTFPFIAMLINTIIIAPICEELLFRGIIFGLLRPKLSPFIALLVSSILFGASHFTLLHLIIGTLMGMVFCLVYEASGMILLPIILHSVYNLLSQLITILKWPNFDRIVHNNSVMAALGAIVLVWFLMSWSSMEEKSPERRNKLKKIDKGDEWDGKTWTEEDDKKYGWDSDESE